MAAKTIKKKTTKKAKAIPAELADLRQKLSSEINDLIEMIHKVQETENEEYDMSEKFGVESVQKDYHEVPMPALGTISTYSGPMASVWAFMSPLVAEALCFERNHELRVL